MQIDESPTLFAQQRHIHQLEEELRNLRNTNKQLNSQLYDITHERNNFAQIQQKDPIRMILHGLGDPASCLCLHSANQILEKRIHLHQEKILTLEQQIRQLNDYLNHKDSQLIKVTQQMQSLKQKENFLINQNRRLNLENQSLKVHKNELMESMGQYHQKWEKLANQINLAKKDFYQKTQRGNQELQACRKNLDQVRNSWLRLTNFFGNEDEWKKVGQSAKIQQLTDKIKLQSQIMQDLGREVDMRNDQILLLQKAQKSTSTKPFNTYEHSLNHMLRSAKERQRNYAELLQKYKQIYENLQESIKQKQILQKQYINMKGLYQGTADIEKENKKIKRELQTVKADFAKLRQINNQLLAQCDAAVEQNDIFFDFMRDIYGSQVFEERIEEEKEKYQERKKQRNSKQLWANTNELIEMNQKLRQKLRKNY